MIGEGIGRSIDLAPEAGTVGGSAGDYSYAGGYVGGYSVPNVTGNLSSYTGVGSASGYQSFTPSANSYTPPATINAYPAPSSPYRGLSQINSGGNSVINSLNGIFTSYQSGSLSNVDALAQATQLQGELSNSSFFYQAKKGKDASALANFKSQAAAIVSAIASWVKPVTTTQSPDYPGVPSTPTTDGGSGTDAGILDQLKTLLGTSAPSSTDFNAPPNLYQVTPTGDSSSSGSTGNMQKILILAVVGFAAYWLYKKYA